MSDIIQLLPESLANQIHAGEVVQRPSSVVKELVENAIDAGASQIKINLKDAGRTLIQVIDNGCGMSSTDARMSFELHATSKIKSADDLFNIQTMGFRGEALAAISIVADVELRTKQIAAEVGTFIHIVGSKVLSHEPTQCAEGTNFMVKNLFFNTTARRKFLKADNTELKHIISEFQRLALANYSVALSLWHNDNLIYDLPNDENLRMRIISVFGKGSNQKLIPIETTTSVVNISGFIGQPRYAKKGYGEQFFFVNERYMKHLYFHKSVLTALDKLLPPGTNPSYFIFFEVDPSKIDVNVSPNKTEVKFEQERDIWHILSACIRESLGKFNLMPSIDFNQQESIEIPVVNSLERTIQMPSVSVNTSYNPFHSSTANSSSVFSSKMNKNANNNISNPLPSTNWDSLYHHFESTKDSQDEMLLDDRETKHDKQELNLYSSLPSKQMESIVERKSFQLNGKYIISPVKSGLMVINQHRAHQRILYEKYLALFHQTIVPSQQLLFPHQVELSREESILLTTLEKELEQIGFKIEEIEPHVFKISAVPSLIDDINPVQVLQNMLARFDESEHDLRNQTNELMAEKLAFASAIDYGKILLVEEQIQLIDQLFACDLPNYTSDGKLVLNMLTIDDLDGMFS